MGWGAHHWVAGGGCDRRPSHSSPRKTAALGGRGVWRGVQRQSPAQPRDAAETRVGVCEEGLSHREEAAPTVAPPDKVRLRARPPLLV